MGTPAKKNPTENCIRSAAGFTLVELIIVMLIITTMAMAVMPIFRDTYADLKEETTVQNILTAMKYAQARAVTDGIEYRIYFSPKKNAYWLMRQTVTEDFKRDFEPVQDRHGHYTVLPDKFILEKPKAHRDRENESYYISFFPSGASDIATIFLARASERRKKYEIETSGTLSQFKLKKP